MARRGGADRIEPSFGGGKGLNVSADRPGRAPSPPPPWRGGKRSTATGGRRRRSAERPRRSFLGRLFRRTFYWGLVLSLWGFIAVAGLVGFYAAELPGASEWRGPERPPNIQILAVDGRLIGNRGDTGGESVRIEQLPEHVPDAVIAIEDRRFRFHFGLDPIGLVRAVAKNLFAGGVVEGGSTLTQQLAKNMFLTPERSVKRKVQEAVLAVWLEAKYSKDEILEMYLNRVYFGAGAYGIDAAARRYFDREPTELTLPQAAMLAGLLPAPSYYAPNRNPDAARERAALVLAAMRDQGFITSEQEVAARDQPAQAASLHMTRSENYIADWVMDVLPFHLGSVERDVVVETTVDMALQEAAERAIAETLDTEGPKYGAGEAALVALDGTGAVRAMVGGRNYAKSQFNRAVDARRQPGSTFKPFVYLTALERGLRPDTIRIDQPVTFGNWSPRNSHEEFRGPVTLKTALALSINTVAAQLAAEVGPEAVVQTARRMGINSALAPNPSIALGTSEVTLMELTGAYAPFANGGTAAMPYVIQRIRTPEGDVLFERTGSGLGQVATPQSVAMMNDMLQATIETGTGTKAALPGWQVAGKTGTSQEYRDAWFVGYTANLVAGVWIGNDSNTPMKRVFGGTLPATIWSKFMIRAHDGVDPTPLPGADLLPMLMAQPAPGLEGGEGWGFAAASPAEQAQNEARMRDIILSRGYDSVPAAAPHAAPAGERRGFFRRLFGG
ncbi:MAG TPA: penicillin-binding protein 1A [Propylenella sp.]|nr:penicillin-binding protein 1A [Propylenella sp.]